MAGLNVPALAGGDSSHLVLVDVQPRLAAAMDPPALAATLANIDRLLRSASLLAVPMSVTEQYPKGLGSTEPAIVAALPRATRTYTKTSFSCCGAEGFVADLDIETRPQIVLTGIEAHVCVLQTALELQFRGFQVFVVEDATCSRAAANHANAMHRLRQAGITVSSTESTLFEWLGDATHPQFKAVSALLK